MSNTERFDVYVALWAEVLGRCAPADQNDRDLFLMVAGMRLGLDYPEAVATFVAAHGLGASPPLLPASRRH